MYQVPVGRLMRGASGLVAGWAGQSGVLVPGDVTVVAASRLHRHLPSTCDLGINVQHTKLYLLPVLASPENKHPLKFPYPFIYHNLRTPINLYT